MKRKKNPKDCSFCTFFGTVNRRWKKKYACDQCYFSKRYRSMKKK